MFRRLIRYLRRAVGLDTYLADATAEDRCVIVWFETQTLKYVGRFEAMHCMAARDIVATTKPSRAHGICYKEKHFGGRASLLNIPIIDMIALDEGWGPIAYKER